MKRKNGRNTRERQGHDILPNDLHEDRYFSHFSWIDLSEAPSLDDRQSRPCLLAFCPARLFLTSSTPCA